MSANKWTESDVPDQSGPVAIFSGSNTGLGYETAGVLAAQGGQYYGPDGVGEVMGYPKLVESSPQSHDEALQKRLWTVSEELTGVRFPV